MRDAPWHMRNLALRAYEGGSKKRLEKVLLAAGQMTDEVYPRFEQFYQDMCA